MSGSVYGDDADIAGELDVSGDTELGDSATDVHIFSGSLYVSGSIYANHRIYNRNDVDTYLDFGDNEIDVVCNGTSMAKFSSVNGIEGSAYIGHLDDSDTYFHFTNDAVYLRVGGTPFVGFTENSSDPDETCFNDAGANVDFRVESEHDANMIFVDASQDNVGIGTASPNTNAILELSSSREGLLLPRVPSASKPTATSALNGLILYEEDTHRLKIVANGEWCTISYE